MTILESEMKAFKPLEVSDAATNGGRMSANEIVSNVVQNVFAHVFRAERLAGSSKYRKLFYKTHNDDDNTLYGPGYLLDGPTAGDDRACFWPGSQRDTQADAAAYSGRIYGAGGLHTTVSAPGSALIVDVEHADLTGIFLSGDTIRIADETNEELHTISGTPSVSGTEVTITLTGTLANGYAAYNAGAGSGGRISSVYEPGDLECEVDNWVETSTSGTFNEATHPVVPDNISTVEQTWTLTFIDATNFGVVGDSVGSVGSGTTGADFAPTNSDWSKPYFTLPSNGWGGTWAGGDTIVFQTHPAATPIWEKRVVPAGAASMANNRIVSITTGETV